MDNFATFALSTRGIGDEYSMNMCKKWSFLGLLVANMLIGLCVHAQDTGRSWALKAGTGGIFTGHISGEVEVFLKGRVSIAVRGALIHPNLDSVRSPAEGFFIKAGPKFYLSKERAAELGGFAIQAQGVFGYWRNWSGRPYTVKVWENSVGAIASLSYGWQPFPHVLIEPHLGIGVAATFEDEILRKDQPPFEHIKQSWYRLSNEGINGGIHSYYPLGNLLAVSGGINVGVKF